jgi:cell division protein FtsQ
MFKKVLNIIVWSLVFIIVGISLGFSIIEQNKAVCREVRVEITDSSKIGFLRSSDIKQWVKKNHGNIFNKKLSNINLRKIEEGLSKFQSIEKVEVYTSIVGNGNPNEGALVARIKQRKPVFRINSAGRDYYVDKYGKFIDWSPRFTPRVMIVGGIVPGDLARKQLLPLIEYINNDPFLNAQIDQIYVSSRGELSMVPRVGEQRIYFGKPDDFQVKFRNLKALYTDGFSSGGWSKYKSINVEYRNQVICTKK